MSEYFKIPVESVYDENKALNDGSLKGARILLRGQADATENGIYVYDSNAAKWKRSVDLQTKGQLENGTLVPAILDGTGTGGIYMAVCGPTPFIGSEVVEFVLVTNYFAQPTPSDGTSTVRDFRYPPGDARRFGLTTGVAVDQSAALQAAIDSGAPVVTLPAGYIYFDQPLVVDRAIRIDGAGSCEGGVVGASSGQPGAATTQLVYRGSGAAVSVVGSGADGVENVHLSNFSLWGSEKATCGLHVGTGVNVSKSSFKNIHICAFNGTA